MAREPEDLVLKHLQNMREDIAAIRQTQAAHSAALESLQKQMDEVLQVSTYTVGMASMAQFKTQELAREIDGFKKLLADMQNQP